MNDTRIWSAAQMRALFPHKKTKRVHHLQAEDALKRGCLLEHRPRPIISVNALFPIFLTKQV